MKNINIISADAGLFFKTNTISKDAGAQVSASLVFDYGADAVSKEEESADIELEECAPPEPDEYEFEEEAGDSLELETSSDSILDSPQITARGGLNSVRAPHTPSAAAEFRCQNGSKFNTEEFKSSIEKAVKIHSGKINESETFISGLTPEQKESFSNALEKILLKTEEEFHKIKDNNGVIAQYYDSLRNLFGAESASNGVQGHFDKLKSMLADIKSGKAENPDKELAELYNQVTGNYLTGEEVRRIQKWDENPDKSKTLFPNASPVKNVENFRMSSDYADDYASFAAISAAWIATGGAAMPVHLASIFFAGLAPHVLDGMTEKDGYAWNEFAADAMRTAAYTVSYYAGQGAAKGITKGISALFDTQAAPAAVQTAIAGAEKLNASVIYSGLSKTSRYAADVLEGKEKFTAAGVMKAAKKGIITGIVNIPASKITKQLGALISGSKGAAHAVSGAAQAAADSSITQKLAGIAEHYLKDSASDLTKGFLSGNMSYFTEQKLAGREINTDDMLAKGFSRMTNRSVTGLITGAVIESLTSDSPLPEGAAAVYKDAAEDGLEYIDYLDETGRIIARDINEASINNPQRIMLADNSPQIRRIYLKYE